MISTLEKPARSSRSIRKPRLEAASFGPGGKGADIRYIIVKSDLGRMLISATEHGLCGIELGQTDAQVISSLGEKFPNARSIERSRDAIPEEWIDAVMAIVEGREPQSDVPLDVAGTAFQRRVWEALLAIPSGQTRSYQEIAAAIGQPTACRAAAAACGANPVGLLIPCHRVIRQGGALGGYYWGLDRKKLLLDRERGAMFL